MRKSEAFTLSTAESPARTGSAQKAPCFIRPDGSTAPIVLTGVAPLDALQASWATQRSPAIPEDIRTQVDALITKAAGDAILSQAWPGTTPDFYGDCRTIASEIIGTLKNEDGRTMMLRSELFFLPMSGSITHLKQMMLDGEVMQRITDMIADRLTGGAPTDICRFGVYPRLVDPMAAITMTPSFLRQMTSDMTLMVLAGGLHPDREAVTTRLTPFLVAEDANADDRTAVTALLMFCRLRFSDTQTPVRDHLYDSSPDDAVVAARQAFKEDLDTWLRNRDLFFLTGIPGGLDDSLAVAACQMIILMFLIEADMFGHAQILPFDRVSIEDVDDMLFVTGSKRLRSTRETRAHPTVQRFGPAGIDRHLVTTRRPLFEAFLQSNSFVRVTAEDIGKDIVLN